MFGDDSDAPWNSWSPAENVPAADDAQPSFSGSAHAESADDIFGDYQPDMQSESTSSYQPQPVMEESATPTRPDPSPERGTESEPQEEPVTTPAAFEKFSYVSLLQGQPARPSGDVDGSDASRSERRRQFLSEENTAFQIEVKNPQVQGEGVSAYVTYTVKSSTTLDFYAQKEMEVQRRFSDFLWLQTQLSENHKGVVIPHVPHKDLLRTNKISGNPFSAQFLEYRRRELQRFLTRVASHPILSTSKLLQIFLETKDKSKFVTAKEEKPKSSSGGFFSMLTKAVTVSGPTAGTEVDPWFAEKSKYVASLKQHLETLAISATAVTQYHQDAIPAHTPFMKALKAMSTVESESDGTLSKSFLRLSEIVAQLEIFEHELAETSEIAFVGVLEDYARLTDGVQKVLDWRLFKLGDYQAAEKELRRARASGQKDQALDSVRQKVEEAREIFDSSSELVRSEVERFEETKGAEIHLAISEFVQNSMNREILMRDLWQKFMIDFQ